MLEAHQEEVKKLICVYVVPVLLVVGDIVLVYNFITNSVANQVKWYHIVMMLILNILYIGFLVSYLNNKKVQREVKEELRKLSEMEKTNNFLEVIKRKNGERLTSPLSRGGHLLMAGLAGSGKSVLQRNMALSFIESYSVDDIKLGLISIEKDSFGMFRDRDLPHLLTSPISRVEEAKRFVSEINNEIKKRINIFKDEDVRNIEEYRENIERMHYIYLFLDGYEELVSELKDTEDLDEFEKGILNIVVLGRIVGIYITLSTQRSSSDIIRPDIKANLVNRACLKVSNEIESLMTINEVGGERLNVGELIFKGRNGEDERCDIEFIDDEELKKRINNVTA